MSPHALSRNPACSCPTTGRLTVRLDKTGPARRGQSRGRALHRFRFRDRGAHTQPERQKVPTSLASGASAPPSVLLWPSRSPRV